MFANKTRVLLTFREDVLGRARASESGKIRSRGGWRLGGVIAERSAERRWPVGADSAPF